MSAPALHIRGSVLVGPEDVLDEVWVVDVDVETAVERLMARNKLTKEEALKRVGAQMSGEERRKHADVVFENKGTVNAMKAKI